MKQLLIILSLLLLSSPLFGQMIFDPLPSKGFIVQGGGRLTLFLWNKSSGQEWTNFGDEEIQTIYRGMQKGEQPNLYPHGLGIMYNGFIEVGGKILYDKNSILIGEWKNGKIHGQGTLKRGKTVLEGRFKEGKRWNTKLYSIGNLLEKYENGVQVCFGKFSNKKKSTKPVCPKE